MSSTARIAWVCAAALTVFVVWISTDVSANAGIGFFYAVPVGLATWWFGARAGAAAVAGCAVLYTIGSLIQPVPDFGTVLAVRVAAFAGVAVVVSLLRERLIVLEHSAEELEAIRAALTPSSLPELPSIDAAAAFAPSEYGVSGDFYLLTNGPDGSTVAIVGDVVGHGPNAARLATFIRARFAAFAASISDPAELLTLANGALLDRPGRQRELVSAVCLRFQAPDAQLSWAVAGHPLPLRLPGLEELTAESDTFLMGARADLDLRNSETSLADGGGVVIYTDGATDVRREGALLGRDGLTRLLSPLTGLPARAMVIQAESEILKWTDEPIRDDLCVLVLKPKARGRLRPEPETP
jgi:serine phosphatase RsbU (regulator of sigma subunit)